MRIIGGYLENGTKTRMISNGYWIGSKGRHVTSYIKVDSVDGVESDGTHRQYSLSRCNGRNIFYLETEDSGYYI